MPSPGTAALEVERLEDDALEVELLPRAGARLHRLRVFGHDLLRTPGDRARHLDDPFFWGAYHLLPWANRISPGPTTVGRRIVDLAANFKDGTAIHGLHYLAPWEAESPGVYGATGGGDDQGWPWPYSVRVEIRIRSRALAIRHEVANLSDEPMPAGAGVHPWFVAPVEVRIPARVTIASNTDPHAPHEAVRGELDLGELQPLPERLDAAWTDLVEPGFDLRWPELGIAAGVRASAPALYVVAANPGRLGAVAVEPQTHAPWGLRRMLDGERGGMAWLEPGATLTLQSELSFRRAEKEQS